MKLTPSLSLGILLFSISASPQTQTQDECLATVRARAAISLNSAQIHKLCAENPMEVVNCALTQMQGARFSSNLNKSLKQCRLEWMTTTVNGQGIF